MFFVFVYFNKFDWSFCMFYDIFLSLCQEKGIKPSAAAEACGINRSNVSLWKSKGYTPRSEALNAIAEYFGVSVDYLLGNEKEPATDSDGFRLEDDIDLTDVDIAFLGGFKELTEENQATIRDMVRIMRERQKE
jgi:transcriptional regulator with XRE-family HTH domain